MGFRELRQALSIEEFDYQLLLSYLSKYANPRNKISRLLKERKIIRVKKGLYVFGESYRKGLVCKETLANLIYGPSYLSFEYALSFYGMIPERVEVLTSATTGRTQTFHTPLGTFSYHHLSPKQYQLGVLYKQLDPYHRIFIASPEKALLDQCYIAKGGEGAIEEYLLHDLRIDHSSLQKLDREKLKIIASQSTMKIKRIVKFIEDFQRDA